MKDPELPDTLYVTELVAPNTVNTMPQATLDAVADHGTITGDTVRGCYDAARAHLDAVESVGVSMSDVVETLENEGVDKFVKSWEELLDRVAQQLAANM